VRVSAGRQVFTIILLVLACLSCSEKNEEASPSEAGGLEKVRVARPEKKQVCPEFNTYGTIIYKNKANIYPDTEGTVVDVLVEEGEKVREGQILAVLSRDTLLLTQQQIEAEVASKQALLALAEEKLREGRRAVEARLLSIRKAEAELEYRKAEFENISQIYSNKKKLHQAGGIAAGELEAVRTRFITIQTKLAQAEKDLEIQRIGFRDQDITAAGLTVPESTEQRYEALVEVNTRMLVAEGNVAEAELGASRSELRRINLMIEKTAVRSPLTGIVGMRLVDSGEKATRDTQLFTLFCTDTVYAQVDVGERDLHRVRVGQEAEVSIEGDDHAPWRGRVALITPYINPQTRTARVRIALANPAGGLIPGMFVRVRIFTGMAEPQLLIPQEAVITEPQPTGASAVYVVRRCRLFRREVTVGQKQGACVVVLDGLIEGEAVVLDPSLSYRDGTEVEVIQ